MFKDNTIQYKLSEEIRFDALLEVLKGPRVQLSAFLCTIAYVILWNQQIDSYEGLEKKCHFVNLWQIF